MWFLKVFIQRTAQSIIIDYCIHENVKKQGEKGFVAFQNLKSAFQQLNLQSLKSEYFKLFDDIEIKEDIVKHTISSTYWEETNLITDNQIQKQQYNSLISQMVSFFKQDLLICVYNFQKTLRSKIDQKKFSFMIFPGLILSDDSSQRSVNLQESLRKLVRPQIFHKTNKKLEILTFMKSYVTLLNQRFFDNIVASFKNELEFLAKENIFLDVQCGNEITCKFILAYDTSKKLNYDINANQYTDTIDFTFQVEKEKDQYLFEQLNQIKLFLQIDSIQMQNKKLLNDRLKKENEFKQKLESAFNQFYDENYVNEEKLNTNYKNLESAIQDLEKVVSEQQLNEQQEEENKQYFKVLREDMNNYKTTKLQHIKIKKQIDEIQ
ncbi:hypothetical protein ABPG74_021338 [Tetrahymena malaccensis]